MSFKKGDRVRVEYDGTVSATDHGHILVTTDDGGFTRWAAASSATKLPDPEPEWKEGDVILVQGQRVYQYDYVGYASESWRGVNQATSRAIISKMWRNGDIVRLVPEGQK